MRTRGFMPAPASAATTTPDRFRSRRRPELALNSALTLSEPTNLIQVVLHGIGTQDGAPGLIMPAYASAFSDADVARLAAYLRRTRTTRRRGATWKERRGDPRGEQGVSDHDNVPAQWPAVSVRCPETTRRCCG